MSTKPRPEIIEVFDVDPASDVDALAMVPGGHATLRLPSGEQRGPAGSDGGEVGVQRRWWIVPAAVATIAAVFAAVALLTGTDDATRTSASTSAPPPSAAGPAVVAVVPATPAGYVVTGVQTGTPATPASTGLVTELYASQVDSASRSSWVQITAGPAGGWYLGAGASRVSAPWGVAVFGNRSDGALTLSGPIAGGGAIIASSGVSRMAVHEIFSGLRFEEGRLKIFDGRLSTTFQRVATDGADGGAAVTRTGATTAVVSVTYGRLADGASGSGSTGGSDPRPVNPADSFTVTTGPMQPPSQEVTRRFFLDDPQTFTVSDQELVVGSDTREHSVTSVVLERAGRQITVSGTASRAVIMESARTMHVADGAELGRLLRDAGATPPELKEPKEPTTRFDLAAGQLDDGRPWDLGAEVSCIVAVQPDQHCVMTSLVVSSGGDPTEVPITEQTAGISIAATPTLTAVVAFIPRNLDGAAMVVTSNGEERVVAPTGIGEGDLVAAYAFDSLAPFTVEIRSNGRAVAGASG